MTNINEELIKIWETESFVMGQKYFWLYNYGLFRIIDKEEFIELNKNVGHSNKNVFAVADTTNGDEEHTAYLYFDSERNSDIYIKSNFSWREPKLLRKIANDLGQLFGVQDYPKRLILKNDKDFWDWLENSYHEYGIENTVPAGVFPDFDLRIYFKEKIKGTFLSDHKAIDTNAFNEFFQNFELFNLDTEALFEYKLTVESLNDFINKVNTQLKEKVFFVVSFNPSAFWGIGNFKFLTSEEAEQIYTYGLID